MWRGRSRPRRRTRRSARCSGHWIGPRPVSGMQGQWVEFTHTLGPEPQTLHPVKVYGQDGTLKGVGKYATSFGAGTAPDDMFGDGRDGVMPSSGNLDNNNGVGVGVVNSGRARDSLLHQCY